MYVRITALAAALLLAQGVGAQTWTAQEQEVLDQLEECWDIWMEGIRSRSPDRWIRDCSAPGMTFWWSADGAPSTNEWNVRNWELNAAADLGWADIRPVSLIVDGDLAVLHFYGYWRATSGDGEVLTEAKRTEVFRRLDGRWKLLVGHGSPVTMEDAAPYRVIRR